MTIAKSIRAFLDERMEEDPHHLHPLPAFEDPTGRGWTLLHIALGQQLPGSVLLWVVEAGISPTATTTDGRTAIDMATLQAHASDYHKKTLEMFLTHTDPLWASPRGITALHHAASLKNPGVVRMLLEQGARPLARSSGGQVPVENAADPETLALFLDHGVKVDMRLSSGQSLLGHFVQNPSMAGLLLERGARVDGVDARGSSPLHHLLSNARMDMGTLEKLIAAGAPLNAQDRKGNGPMHLAAISGNGEAMACLAAAGARLGMLNQRGKTPLDLVPAGQRPLLEKLVLESGLPDRSLPRSAARL